MRIPALKSIVPTSCTSGLIDPLYILINIIIKIEKIFKWLLLENFQL